MRDMNQENLNPFIGLCNDAPNICMVTAYCSRGSLQVRLVYAAILEARQFRRFSFSQKRRIE